MGNNFDRYSETLANAVHAGQDFETLARGYSEYYYDCLPADLDAPILDVGCGMGQFLRFLEMQGYRQVEGIELSAQQAELARQHVKCPVYVEDVEEFLSERQGQYAMITANDVLEHIPKEQTVDFLEILGTGLSSNGSLIVNVPQVSGLTTGYYRYNDFTHQVVFTEMSLRQVLLMAGFREVRFVAENWPLKFNFYHLSYRFARWCWYHILKLIYFIELPGEKHPNHWGVRIVAIARK